MQVFNKHLASLLNQPNKDANDALSEIDFPAWKYKFNSVRAEQQAENITKTWSQTAHFSGEVPCGQWTPEPVPPWLPCPLPVFASSSLDDALRVGGRTPPMSPPVFTPDLSNMDLCTRVKENHKPLSHSLCLDFLLYPQRENKCGFYTVMMRDNPSYIKRNPWKDQCHPNSHA